MRVYFYVILSWILGLDATGPLERAFEKRLMNIDGLEDACVRLEATRWGLLISGRLRRVTVEMKGLRIGGVRAEQFRIVVLGLRMHPFLMFVRNTIRLREAGEAEWSIRICEEDLETYFQGRGALWKLVRVAVADGFIDLRLQNGMVSMLGVTPMLVRAGLRLREDGHIDLVVDDLQAFGISPGRTLIGRLMGMVNPVIRANAVNRVLREKAPEMLEPFVIHNTVRSVDMDAGEVTIEGEIFSFRKDSKQAEFVKEQ